MQYFVSVICSDIKSVVFHASLLLKFNWRIQRLTWRYHFILCIIWIISVLCVCVCYAVDIQCSYVSSYEIISSSAGRYSVSCLVIISSTNRYFAVCLLTASGTDTCRVSHVITRDISVYLIAVSGDWNFPFWTHDGLHKKYKTNMLLAENHTNWWGTLSV
jgi:hypothetical protein